MVDHIPCFHVLAGCPFSFPDKLALQDHEETCSWGHMNCPLNCGEKLRKRDLTLHLSETCTCRYVSCSFCPDEIVFKNLQDHLEDCGDRPINCPHCQDYILKKELEAHLEDCPAYEQPCRYKDLGCKFSGVLATRREHEQDINLHFPLLCTITANLQTKAMGILNIFNAVTVNKKEFMQIMIDQHTSELINTLINRLEPCSSDDSESDAEESETSENTKEERIQTQE